MRISCPLCGARDLREFTYLGDDTYLARPELGDADGYDAYLHLRDNPAGETLELWYHGLGCGAWLRVRRDTRSHEIIDVALARAEGAA
ncbi:sarcosine oxidase subunit delta [Dinoroseobacter sp. S76]|uniref:sarcosine oxidase subunit delta n=1 Tax=Dinoroseobacter sp. S76 TaxID=3415124 RepID=UPI003C79D19C